MSFQPTDPITGTAQTGLTTPTYSVALDSPPANNAKQYYVYGLGGTQTGVAVHSVSLPFTLAMWRPLSFKVLQPVNPVTGVLQNVPTNVYKVITRKGVVPLAGQAPRNLVITTMIEVPAGADVADPNSIAAAMSAHIGLLSQQSANIGNTTKNGAL